MAKECILNTGKLPPGGFPRNSVERITDRPEMASAVGRGRKALNQTKQKQNLNIRGHVLIAYRMASLCKSTS